MSTARHPRKERRILVAAWRRRGESCGGTVGAPMPRTADGLVIHGVSGFTGGRVESHNDHRIAMAVAIASMRATGKIILDGAEAVNKSYPHFWEDFTAMGGEWIGLDLGK